MSAALRFATNKIQIARNGNPAAIQAAISAVQAINLNDCFPTDPITIERANYWFMGKSVYEFLLTYHKEDQISPTFWDRFNHYGQSPFCETPMSYAASVVLSTSCSILATGNPLPIDQWLRHVDLAHIQSALDLIELCKHEDYTIRYQPTIRTVGMKSPLAAKYYKEAMITLAKAKIEKGIELHSAKRAATVTP